MIVAVLVATLFTFDVQHFWGAYAHWSTPDSIASRLATWDSAHYLHLSQDGYRAGSKSCAFYPLWPGVIGVASWLTLGHPLVAALLLANGLSLGVFVLFYRLVQQQYGATTANDTLILLLAFPGALFFSFPYTESFYLFMVLVFFLELERGRYLWPGIIGFLMPLTKAIGVFIVLPLAWHLYERKAARKYWLLLLLPLLGYAAYFGTMGFSTGNPFEGFLAQKEYPNSPSIRNMFDLAGMSDALLDMHSMGGMMDAFLDRFLFFVFLGLLPWVYRLNKTWFLFAFAAGLVPALTSWFMSYRRYFMVCFPLFIVMAQLLQRPKSRIVFWYYVLILAGLQFWAITRFVNFNWAG